jgi:peptidyl-prolyl cis-trans isomerase C
VKPVPAQLPDAMARVNGETISKTDFDRAVTALEARNGGPVPAPQRDRVFRDVLDQLVAYRLLMQESRARKLAAADAEVDARIKEIQAQFPSEDAFKQMLTSRKTTIDQVREDIRQDITVQKLIESEIADKVAVKPEQVTDFYTKNPDQFKQPERVRASHILIMVPKGSDEAAKTAARTKAAEILKDVKAGKDFAALAKQHSQDPGSAQNGGDLGFFQQGQMVGPFNDAAFTLTPGTVSDLVETEFGFHIIKVAEKQTARTVPLEEVRPQLEQYLQRMNREQQTDAFVNGLKAKGKIEILI